MKHILSGVIAFLLVLSLIPAAIVFGVIFTIVTEYCGYESLWPAFVGAAVAMAGTMAVLVNHGITISPPSIILQRSGPSLRARPRMWPMPRC